MSESPDGHHLSLWTLGLAFSHWDAKKEPARKMICQTYHKQDQQRGHNNVRLVTEPSTNYRRC